MPVPVAAQVEPEEFAWVTSHAFRKTAAMELDRAGLSARQIADQLGHAKVSMTQDRYLGRRAVDSSAADALDRAHREAKRGIADGYSVRKRYRDLDDGEAANP